MTATGRLGKVLASGRVHAASGATMDVATVAAMLDEHARLRMLLTDEIAVASASDGDYWVGMGVDEVAVRGELPGAVMTAIDGRRDGSVIGCL